MTRRRRTLLFVLAFVAVAMSAPFLGGSMVWYLGGAHSLDIHGRATAAGRPPNTVDVGHGWTHYGGDAGGHRYSQASQISVENVERLAPAWQYRTGDMTDRAGLMSQAATEGTPILAEGSLVFCTPFNEVIALDPGTGAERWRFDAEIDLDQYPANQFVCRGVAHWREGESSGACAGRIFMGTNDARLVAIDVATGRRCAGFGDNGEVWIDPGRALMWPGEFQITSPPVTVGDTVVVGSAIADNARVAAPVGSVRAFDARTGAPRWDWDPIPRSPDQPASSSWQGSQPPVEGHANAWAPMSVDEERGLVFVPTSSPSPDFFGGLRPGDNRHANAVVALVAKTGQVRWSFQTVHHDVWDYDLPAQPGLYSVWRDGRVHDVVAQVTKTGLLFVLDRDTGEPFLPVEERPVSQQGAPGEVLSPTQPFPVATPPVVPNRLTPDDAFGLTWFDREHCRARIADSLADGLFTPPSEQGTLLFPFTGGGANWGSAAYDPGRNLLVINMNNLAHHIQLIPAGRVEAAREVYHDQEVAPQTGAPFGVKRELLVSPLGIPCTHPPWGVLAGIDLATGEIVWRRALGDVEGINLGTPTLGGPIVTAGGLVFIASSAIDDTLRAFDIVTGEELWHWRLPAAGQATPMSYVWEGRQYVLIYAGGNPRSQSRLGDALVAFGLN
ncbi:MAG: pyrroloquinoline quinone-dependent dehydrogenase [Gammaproteobacteria bacterium]|nr:pyrroloquinoline quinone-dependent dehydrogenase [Gammaproteobacteria bacterium]MDE0368389.1 pyrroloquinoline quinone-dependent dehydrogenase [Gammaproteobacteria bacterium]